MVRSVLKVNKSLPQKMEFGKDWFISPSVTKLECQVSLLLTYSIVDEKKRKQSERKERRTLHALIVFSILI